MSEPVSAQSGAPDSTPNSAPNIPLDRARFQGFVTVAETGLQGMLSLRGDLGAGAVKKAVRAAVGLALPAPRRIILAGGSGVGWMAPDELLLMMPYADVARARAAAEAALAGAHALLVDMSDARVMFRVAGAGAGEVLAKLAPVDIAALGADELRRSRLAQVPAAFWRCGDADADADGEGGDAFSVVAFRSVARYVFDLLCGAAAPGSEVGFF